MTHMITSSSVEAPRVASWPVAYLPILQLACCLWRPETTSRPDASRARFATHCRLPMANPRFAWKNLVAEVGTNLGDGTLVLSRQFTQGRLMGGNSSIMGILAQDRHTEERGGNEQ